MIKKKILFIIPSLAIGGSQRVILNLLKGVNRKIFDVSLIIVKEKGGFYDQIPDDIKIEHLDCKRMLFSFIPLYKSVYKLNPDLVFSTLGYLNFTLILIKQFMLRRFKLIVRESNAVSEQLKELNNKWLWWLLYRFLYKKADKVICQSHFMLNELSDRFSIPKERMVVLYNPINISEIRDQADADLNPFMDSGNGPNIIGVGRLVHQKGYERILNFIPKILEKYPDVKFWILGIGELEFKLKELINDLDISNHVYFVGIQKNPYVWMKHADLFVLSSYYEGLPNALLEAITNGCPILSLKHPGGTEEILDLLGCSNRFINSFSLDNFFDKGAQFSDKILTEYFSDAVIIKKYEQEFIKILG